MNRVAVSPTVIRWARERAGRGVSDLAGRFPRIEDWEAGAALPTLRQAEDFAKATRVPFGFLFLPEPPAMPLPFADFRTLPSHPPREPSPDLMDTIHLMQNRQAWLSEDRAGAGDGPLDFVGAATIDSDPLATGQAMRRRVGLDSDWAQGVATWADAVGKLREAIEGIGVMAVINGVVGNSTNRVLDVGEFRGFALCDRYAPLIFVNGADAKSAQMFTLAHELAHLWLGEAGEGLSGFDGGFDDIEPGGGAVEQFCDRAAAEFLVPAAEITAAWPDAAASDAPFDALARRFKVSPVVIGRRAMDLRLVSRERFFDFHNQYIARERGKHKPSGGDFYNNQNTRIGSLFGTQLVRAAKEGRVSFKEAYRLSGLHGGTFERYALKLGVALP